MRKYETDYEQSGMLIRGLECVYTCECTSVSEVSRLCGPPICRTATAGPVAGADGGVLVLHR